MRARREPLRILGSRRSAGVIDWMIAATRSSSRSSMLLDLRPASRPCPGSIPSSLPSEPIFLTACICSRKSSRVKSSPADDLGGHLLGLVGVERLLGLLDEGEHVAHAEDARGHPVGVEDARSRSSFSPVEANMIGRAGDRRAPTAPRHRGRRRRAWSGRRRRSRRRRGTPAAVLTASWPIIASTTSSVSSGWTASRMSRGLLHQLLVDRQPAGGVDDDHVVAASRSALARRRRGRPATGSPTPLPGSGAKTGDPGPLADDLQLVDGVGALEVGGDEQRLCGPGS